MEKQFGQDGEDRLALPASLLEEQVVDQHTITFQDDVLTVVYTNHLSFYVTLPSLCVALSLNVKGQVQRIKRSPPLAKGFRLLALDTRGGRQQMYCLHVEWLVEWLASIRLKSVQSALEEKVAVYQKELPTAVYDIFHRVGHLKDQPWLKSYFDRTPAPFEKIEAVVVDDSLNKEKLMILATLPPSELTARFTSTDNQIDRSMREAVFAQEEQWEVDANTRIFSASNNLQIYLGSPESPLELSDAQEKIRALGGSTTLTARVVMGLWNLRRGDARLSLNGSAAINIDEIFDWRGLKKHQRSIYPGAHRKRTDGYRPEQKQQVLNDLALLASCCVRGHCTVTIKGRKKTFYINGPYLRYSTVTTENIWGEQEIVGFFISPGDWITTYELYEDDYLAEIDRRVFQLNPQNEQHELRIALYLVEQWRQQAHEGYETAPLVMNDLLTASMIPLDKINMTRFANRIEDALDNLWKRGIIQQPVLLTPIDKGKARWGNDWLMAQWRIPAPQEIMDTYIQRLRRGKLPISSGRKQSTKKKA